MSDTPRVGTINAERVVVAREIHGGIHAQDVTVLTFPSGQGIHRVFASVPAQGPALEGRDQTFAELRKRAADGGRLALYGLPGAGKSALALALAYDEATLERFEGGVLWAGLGPQPSVDNVLDLWGTALGVDATLNRPSRTATERAQRLSAYVQSVLGGKPFLVVLDDAWRLEDLFDFEYFATPGYAVLVTTREPALARRFANAPERVVHIHELDESAALDLLTRAAPEAVAVAPGDLRMLARAVGHLPLALVLMGRELAAHAGQERWIRHTLKQLQSAEDRLALTESARRPGLSGVPLSLQAVVELSLDTLPDAARNAFAALGVFAPKPADFSRAAAIAVWQVSEDVGDTFLRTLYEHGLLEDTGQDRFSLHQVLAAVGYARSDDSAAAAARHFAYYLDLVNVDREAWQVIGAELPQIQQTWEWATRSAAEHARVLQLSDALRLFMERRGLRAQQRAWLERAVDAARALGDKAEEGRLLGSLGLCWWQLGQHSKAIGYLEDALALARDVGDRQAEGRHLGSLGLVLMTAMLRDQAIGYYEQALAIARELDDRRAEESHLGSLGVAWSEEGMAKLTWGGDATKEAAAPDLRKAIAYYQRALTIARAIGDRPGIASHLGNLGNAWLHLGDAIQAIDLLNQALTVLREIGDRPNEGFHLANLGSAHQAVGNGQEAQRCWREALSIYETYGDPRAGTLKAWLQTTTGTTRT